MPPAAQPAPVVELESRQDEILRQLDDLNRRLERTLKEWTAAGLSVAGRRPAGDRGVPTG